MNGKTKLMSAAAGLFAKETYEQVGVARILADAGVQAPTLYYHFGDKEGLYAAWAPTALERLGTRIGEAIARYSGLVDRLAAIQSVLAEAQECDLGLIMRDVQRLSTESNRETVLSAYLEHVHEPICASLLHAIETGILEREPIGRLAATFVAGALAGRAGLPGAAPSSEPYWWPERFVRAFSRMAQGRDQEVE